MERWGANESAFWRWAKSPSETQKKEIQAEFESAVEELKSHFGTALPKWGQAHQISFDPISKHFRREVSMPSAGDTHAVSPGSSDWEKGMNRQTAGASHRMVVVMSTPVKAYFGLAGVNSGSQEPDFGKSESEWVQWRDCHLHPVTYPFDWKAHAAETIRF